MAGAYDYHQMLDLVEAYYGSGSDQWLKVVGASPTSADELLKILQQTPGVDTLVTESGQYAGWRLAAQESYGAVSNVGSLVNSNTAGGSAAVQTSGLIQVPGNFTETAGTIGAGSGAIAAATGASVTTVVGTAIAATLAVGTGISLGKTIDKAIYEGGQALGFSADDLKNYDPDTWGNISLRLREAGMPEAEVLFNVLFNVDPSKQTSQMYVDENAYAYMAYALQQMGLFTEQYTEPDVSSDKEYISSISYLKKSQITSLNYSFNECFSEVSDDSYIIGFSHPYSISQWWSYYGFYSDTDPSTYLTTGDIGSNSVIREQSSFLGDRYAYITFSKNVSDRISVILSDGSRKSVTKLGDAYSSISGWITNSLPKKNPQGYSYMDAITAGSFSSIPGSGNQDSAKLPSLADAINAATALELLKRQYPELWEKAIYNDVLQPDGTIKRFTYVPIPTPTSTSKYDTQPTGDGSEQNQNHTDVSPDSSIAIKDLTTTTITSPPDTPNPPDTGGGDSPTVVSPVGKASSLWSIYNPTLEQVNQFGSWLWSSNFVEQLKKLFNDPMQAIIGLHKVYSPVQTSGQGTIKCGYLDSEVPSRLVSEQYVTVDCGSVDLQEYFGNVFDYPPYTEVSIYLPFIGIQRLDPSDVMRSTISVKYHVDVISGACMAEVNVQRDAAGGTLYTFTGDAAVRYPVSSGSYMSMVSSIVSAVAGTAMIAVAPSTAGIIGATAGVAHSFFNARNNVQHSGSFTGNAGAMGSKIPYLIISRPQTAMAENFETLSGYPSNTYTPLSACTGFTQVKFCHVENLTATDSEKQEIEQLLKEGVIL